MNKVIFTNNRDKTVAKLRLLGKTGINVISPKPFKHKDSMQVWELISKTGELEGYRVCYHSKLFDLKVREFKGSMIEDIKPSGQLEVIYDRRDGMLKTQDEINSGIFVNTYYDLLGEE